jgi:hypothetical protein
MEFKYDGGGLAKGGNASLYVDGEKVGEGRVEITLPMFSGDETCDVSRGTGSSVSPDYDPRDNEFNGEVNWVQIGLKKDDHDHMISPEDRFRPAMARQRPGGRPAEWTWFPEAPGGPVMTMQIPRPIGAPM